MKAVSKPWPHLSNVTDEMLFNWYKASALRKLKWLEDVRQFYIKAVPEKKRLAYVNSIKKDSVKNSR